jgi:hypothetical protein
MVKSAAAHSVFDEERLVAEISGDDTPGDIVEVLSQMRFRSGTLLLRLDRATRDYLLDAVIARSGKG